MKYRHSTVVAGLLAFVVSGQSNCLSEEAADLHPAVKAFFNSKDPFVQQTVIPNIDRHNRGDAQLQVVSPSGDVVAGAQVHARLVRHRFLFGCSAPGDIVEPGSARNAWLGLWEAGTSRFLMKWSHIEKQRGVRDLTRLDPLVNYLHEQRCPIEFHFLTGYHPDWLKDKPVEEKGELQRAHALAMIERYRDRIDYFQLYNEIWKTQIDRAEVFFDPKAFLAEVRDKYPDIELGICDCWWFGERLPGPDEVLKQFPGIDYIGMHGHKPRKLWITPAELYDCFRSYVDSELKIHITEFGIQTGEIETLEELVANQAKMKDWQRFTLPPATPIGEGHRAPTGQWTDARRAEYFVQLVATCFSHPAVRGFNFWGMGPNPRPYILGNRLIDDDYQPLPPYEALRSLMKDKLHTEVRGPTDDMGRFTFRGYYGEYHVTVKSRAGKTKAFRMKLAPGSLEHKIVLPSD